MEQNQQELCKLMREYADFLVLVQEQEKDKLSAVLKADLELLEHTLANQQATQKKMENLEQRRIALMQAMGMPDKTLAEFIALLPAEEKKSMNEVLERLRSTAQEVQYMNRKSLDVVEMNLKSISFAEEMAGNELGYNQDRKHTETEKTDAALFSAKV